MGDNLRPMTNLPYSNFEDEPSDEVNSHSHNHRGGHGHSHEGGRGHSHASHVTTESVVGKIQSMSKEKKISIIVAVFLVILSLFSIIYASIEKKRQPFELHIAQCKSVEKFQRIDASLGLVNSEDECWKVNGCWDASAVPPSPKCFYSFADNRGYRVLNSTVTVFGMEFELERNDAVPKMFDDEVERLKCMISYETDSRLRVRIFDPAETRYVVPMSEHHEQAGHRMQYILTATESLFGFSVSRTHEASSTIFNTTLEGLIFSNQLIQLNMALSTNKVYGLHRDGLLRRMEYMYESLWTREGLSHGVHPFFMHLEHDGHASGYFLQNSNAMDIVLSPYPTVTFRTTGGILDFYIFLGPTPGNVIQQFTAQIGAPLLPPLWALGYHYGSSQFENSDQLPVEKLSIPLDGLWLGQSVQKDGVQFTIDEERFPDLVNVSSDLAKLDKRLLYHATPAVRVSDSNVMYTDGAARGIFVRDNSNKTLIAKVDDKDVVFPDYFHPSTAGWLNKTISSLSSILPHSGLYLTENEPTTQSSGSKDGCPDDSFDDPVYTLKHVTDLKSGTLCPSAIHHGSLRHYDVHNIYGWESSRATHKVQRELSEGKRRLTLTRSTYVGSGAHAGHWVEETPSTWDGLKRSITAIMNYNFYGIPLVGVNICGNGDTWEEELCVRWHQLATFYPFAKRFSSTGVSPEDKFSEEGLTRVRAAILARYRLLPYLYSQFYLAHTEGAVVVKPMFFDYLADNSTLSLSSQFLLGDAIMVAPVTDPGATSVQVYFPGPGEVWYDGEDSSVFRSADTGAGWVEVPVTMERIPYFIRGGSVLVRHKNTANSTADIQKKGDYVLEVYLAKNGAASGLLFSDDGVTDHTISQDMYLTVNFNASRSRVTSEVKLLYPGYDNQNTLKEILISGLESAPSSVQIDDSGEDWPNKSYQNGILRVTELNLRMQKAFCVSYES